MSKSMTSKILAGVAAAVLLAGLGVSRADASLVINLKFEDNTTTKTLTSTGDFLVNVYVTVSGTQVGTTKKEGLSFLYYAVDSAETLGGVLGNTSGVSSRELSTDFDKAGACQLGTMSDYDADGIVDLGKRTATAITGDGLTLAKPSGDTTPVYGNADGTNTTFLVETFWVHVASLQNIGVVGAKTTFSPIRPPFTVIATAAGWYEDQVAKTATTTTYTMGSSVEFLVAVPEPATMAFLALGGIGMIGAGLARRRRMRKA